MSSFVSVMLPVSPEPALLQQLVLQRCQPEERGSNHLKRRGGSRLSSLQTRPAGPTLEQIGEKRRVSFVMKHGL